LLAYIDSFIRLELTKYKNNAKPKNISPSIKIILSEESKAQSEEIKKIATKTPIIIHHPQKPILFGMLS